MRHDIDFPGCAQQYLPASVNKIESRRCPDQLAGRLSAFSPLLKRQPVSARTLDPCVVLILESPHTSEFTGDLGPAKGKTGEKIARYLLAALGLNETCDHGLILLNAVQYQCSPGGSLSEPTAKKVRDSVFLSVWHNGGSHSFHERLLTTCRAGDIVVSCCTKGVGSDASTQLRVVVKKGIEKALPETSVIYRTHPASWPRHLGKDWTR